MKNAILSMLMVTALVTSCKNNAKEGSTSEPSEVSTTAELTSISFGVRGNCSMCKSTIEKAAIGVDGVAEADWNVDQKKIDVTFDTSKTSDMAIHNAIAASGYDTEKVQANTNAYDEIPMCCQYDHNMEMSITK